ncbi:hypothetical protein H8356DRAFT_1355589 [Neocallimastix lanati (nom. inval.)]|nr:hypothetical protein H8356DRAFT_1355589 [Neocallimastix sp. JGI-2020a]
MKNNDDIFAAGTFYISPKFTNKYSNNSNYTEIFSFKYNNIYYKMISNFLFENPDYIVDIYNLLPEFIWNDFHPFRAFFHINKFGVHSSCPLLNATPRRRRNGMARNTMRALSLIPI